MVRSATDPSSFLHRPLLPRFTWPGCCQFHIGTAVFCSGDSFLDPYRYRRPPTCLQPLPAQTSFSLCREPVRTSGDIRPTCALMASSLTSEYRRTWFSISPGPALQESCASRYHQAPGPVPAVFLLMDEYIASHFYYFANCSKITHAFKT